MWPFYEDSLSRLPGRDAGCLMRPLFEGRLSALAISKHRYAVLLNLLNLVVRTLQAALLALPITRKAYINQKSLVLWTRGSPFGVRRAWNPSFPSLLNLEKEDPKRLIPKREVRKVVSTY